jgi:hypothetical protein
MNSPSQSDRGMPALSAARLARLRAFRALRRAASRSASKGLDAGLVLFWKPVF